MIGKASWFKRRKWGGWGLYPATWQGWVYVGVFIGAILATNFIPGDQSTRMIALAIVGAVLVIDTIVMMFQLKKDERETLHEAIAERNALWAMIALLTLGVAYQAAQSVVTEGAATVDPVIIIAIFGGLIAKAVTNYSLDKKD